MEACGLIESTWKLAGRPGLGVRKKKDVARAMGLAQADVFYFGNAIGDSGNSLSSAQVEVTDELGSRFNQKNFLNPALIDDLYDYNRDSRVDATDELTARFNGTNFLSRLDLITVPAAGSAVAAPPASSAPVAQAAPAPAVSTAGTGTDLAGTVLTSPDLSDRVSLIADAGALTSSSPVASHLLSWRQSRSTLDSVLNDDEKRDSFIASSLLSEGDFDLLGFGRSQ